MAARSLVPTFIMKTFEMLEVKLLIECLGLNNSSYSIMDRIGFKFCC